MIPLAPTDLPYDRLKQKIFNNAHYGSRHIKKRVSRPFGRIGTLSAAVSLVFLNPSRAQRDGN